MKKAIPDCLEWLSFLYFTHIVLVRVSLTRPSDIPLDGIFDITAVDAQLGQLMIGQSIQMLGCADNIRADRTDPHGTIKQQKRAGGRSRLIGGRYDVEHSGNLADRLLGMGFSAR
ncbi:hypothetical protein [Ruegeria sp. HKCCA4812]|uniref:hypothetical protein n=1 Tax=Ruegeria sp. HKCCA4812 TaxID=2682993 RepID=UPI0020C325C9|nr:hypothetical protein [Ruegeria sp. HKCCA4812]